MLKDILRILFDTKMYSKSNIARELNISEDMVELAIEDLIKRGFLAEEEAGPSCTGSCIGCSIKNCNKEVVKSYHITEKGLKLLS